MQDRFKTKSQLIKELKELRGQNLKLEDNVIEFKNINKNIKIDCYELVQLLMESFPNTIHLKDIHSRYMFCNSHFALELGIKREEIYGKTEYDLYPQEFADRFVAYDQKVIASGIPLELEELTVIGGEKVIVRGVKIPVRNSDGNIIGILGIFTDISELKSAERKLKKTQKMLHIKAKSLEDSNAALRALIKHIEEEKSKIEKNIMTNIKMLIMPYFGKLMPIAKDETIKTYLTIIKQNFIDITKPFAHKLSNIEINLSPVEVQVAQQTKDGKTAKDIAETLQISEYTVRAHKRKIRKKLNIKSKKINLRVYLQSIAKE